MPVARAMEKAIAKYFGERLDAIMEHLKIKMGTYNNRHHRQYDKITIFPEIARLSMLQSYIITPMQHKHTRTNHYF